MTVSAAEGEPVGHPRRGSAVRLLWALAFFAVTTLLWFAPLLPDFGTRVTGRASDGTSALRYYWAAEQQGVSAFELDHDALLAAPEGSSGDPGLGAVGLVQPAFVLLLDGLVGLVASLNLLVLLAFVLSGVLTFGLLNRLGVDFGASLFGGYVFAFNPWHIEKAIEGHAELLQVWILVLVLWALVRMRTRGGLWPTALAGAALVGSFLVHPYVFLLACGVAVVFAIAHTLSPPPDRSHVRAFAEGAAVFGVGAVVIAPIALVTARLADVAAIDRGVGELQRFGAAPLAYVVPSERHPVFGSAVSGLWSAADPRHFAEPTLFFGYTTLLLALATLVRLALRRDSFTREQRFVVAVGAGLVAVGFYASLPRLVDVGPVSLPTPSFAIGEVTTLWRVYARFAVVVCLGLVVLAAFAVQALMRRRRWLVLPLLATVAFELAAGAPLQTWSTKPPEHVRWLAEQPFGIVAHYPVQTLDPAETRMLTEEYFFQTVHGQPLYESFGNSRVALATRTVRALSENLADPVTPGVLAARAVRYVVVHTDVYRQLGGSPPTVSRSLLRPVFRSADASVYVVEAEPARLAPLVARRRARIARALGALPPRVGVGKSGFAIRLWHGSGLGWHRLVQDGAVELDNPAQTETWQFRLRTVAFSPGQARDVRLMAADGTVVGRARVGTKPQRLEMGPFTLPSGKSVLRLRVDPGPAAFGSVGPTGLVVRPPLVEPALDPVAANVPERVSTDQLARLAARRG